MESAWTMLTDSFNSCTKFCFPTDEEFESDDPRLKETQKKMAGHLCVSNLRCMGDQRPSVADEMAFDGSQRSIATGRDFALMPRMEVLSTGRSWNSGRRTKGIFSDQQQNYVKGQRAGSKQAPQRMAYPGVISLS